MTTTPKPKTKATCSCCNKTIDVNVAKDGSAKTPFSWKVLCGKLYCKSCKKANFVLRAISLPVSGPIDAEWKDIGPLFKRGWGDATKLGNFYLRELAKADKITADEKLPPYQKIDLYKIGRNVVPEFTPTSVVSVSNSAVALYVKNRSLIARGQTSLPTFRYPTPIPIPAAAWKPEFLNETDQVPVVSLPLYGQRIRLKLRAGNGFRRNIDIFKKIVNGEIQTGEIEIVRQTANRGDHRTLLADREPGGGQKKLSNVMIKIPVWLPKREQTNEEKKMFVTTDLKSFWIGSLYDKECWRLNADHVRRWVRLNCISNSRLSDDQKAERGQNVMVKNFRSKKSQKFHNRMHTWLHTAASILANFADRKHVTEIVYSDDEKGYFESFPWFNLKTILNQKLEILGVKLTDVSKVEVCEDL